jgi:hypothetical protein
MPTQARSALANLESTGEIDGKKFSERSRSYRDKLAELESAAAAEAEAAAQFAAAVANRLTSAKANLDAVTAQLKTQEDF